MFLFLHAVKTFSLETEGFREREKVAEGRRGMIPLTVALICGNRLTAGCRQRGPLCKAAVSSAVPPYMSALSTSGLQSCLVWCLCRLAHWAWALEQLSWALKPALTV